MTRFLAGWIGPSRPLWPECLDGSIDDSEPVRVIDAFVDAMNFAVMMGCIVLALSCAMMLQPRSTSRRPR